MIITSSGIVEGVILRKYGKFGIQKNSAGMCTYSLPVLIQEAPPETVSFALLLEDKDAVPVCGFSWIHWLVANLTRTRLEENESIHATDYIQGTTSWAGPLGKASRKEASLYGGMGPPDRPHVYELHAFALDTMLDLQPGFYYNEWYWAIEGHVLAQATIKGRYDHL